MASKRITSKMVRCPRCGARPGRDCIGERIGSANCLGGGWGGYLTIQRPHPERVTEAKERQARREALEVVYERNRARRAAEAAEDATQSEQEVK